MLNHRNISLLFILALLFLILAEQKFDVSWAAYLLVLLVFLSIQFYGAAYINSNFHLKAICSYSTKKKIVALSFDDGPTNFTEIVLDVLKEEEIPATFFCIGKNIEGKEHLLHRMMDEGHTIGNHSFSHGYWFDLKTKSAFIDDLKKSESAIKKVVGKKTKFFRPPYGVTTPALAKAVQSLNLNVIGWSLRSLDTKIKDKQQLLTRIKKQIQPGAIILLHDSISGTEIVLKETINYLHENGYTIISLEDLIGKKAYA